ncbi:MAG: ZIP family metal transporter [Candidatus Hodarchaeales archaeon]
MASLFLLLKESTRKMLIPYLVSFASGTLVTAAFLGLIPEGLEQLDSHTFLATVLFGIIAFFVLEHLVILRHCHDEDCEIHNTVGPMILIGDAFHNAVDGLVITGAFLTSPAFGVIVGISILAHELPQEVGDFALLLHSGYSKEKALIYNILSGISTIVVAVLAYFALDLVKSTIPFVIAISAASFIYIALADLYPELHHKFGFSFQMKQMFSMIIGVLTIILLLQFHH